MVVIKLYVCFSTSPEYFIMLITSFCLTIWSSMAMAQVVQISNNIYIFKKMTSWVSQGSILSSIFFVFYVNNIKSFLLCSLNLKPDSLRSIVLNFSFRSIDFEYGPTIIWSDTIIKEVYFISENPWNLPSSQSSQGVEILARFLNATEEILWS